GNCGKGFSQSSHLERHRKIHGEPCRECGKSEGRKNGKKFPKRGREKCGECGKGLKVGLNPDLNVDLKGLNPDLNVDLKGLNPDLNVDLK
ncbi:ZN234 protein, partial [Sitta europaea]|nr:ZN234 protein [Sitta europaea]